jgi:hypothetical protein
MEKITDRPKRRSAFSRSTFLLSIFSSRKFVLTSLIAKLYKKKSAYKKTSQIGGLENGKIKKQVIGNGLAVFE